MIRDSVSYMGHRHRWVVGIQEVSIIIRRWIVTLPMSVLLSMDESDLFPVSEPKHMDSDV